MEQLRQSNLLKAVAFVSGICISVLLIWFAGYHYRVSIRLAEENLNGLALSLSAALETLASKDPSFTSLKDFRTYDIAYFALINRDGIVVSHTNDALLGTLLSDRRYRAVFERGEFSCERIPLGTGEIIHESNFPLHVRGKTLALRLALHTYRADSVIRTSRIGLVIVVSLIAAAWGMTFLLLRYAAREEAYRKEMTQRREMAKLGEMGAVIAHEIRNPLAGIKGYAQLLQEEPGSQDIGQFAGVIVREAIRLEEIVNGLLAYTQDNSKAQGMVGINDAVVRSLDVVFPEAEASGVLVEYSLDRSFMIIGNRNRLEQLFLNLFRNALQAMPGGGMLTVSGKQRGNDIEILVKDSGQGIDGSYLGRIFEPFFTTKARGTGLGLAVCRKIVEEHGGTIAVESIFGSGTTFRIIFPVPRDASEVEEESRWHES